MKVKDSLKDSFDDSNTNLFKLGAENIFLGRKAATKEEAIRFAGEQLVKAVTLSRNTFRRCWTVKN